MSLDQQLSMYLSGDLTDSQHSALERRIRCEPAVAEALEQMRALIASLDHLHLDEVAPPPLPVLVGAQAPLAPASNQKWPTAAAALIAAVLTFFVTYSISNTPPKLLIASGEHYVQGDLSFLAADKTITLDGSAKIIVQPNGPLVRVGAQEDEMNMKLIAAGLGGAAVTVLVYEGSATIASADEVIVVQAGEASTMGTRVKPQKEASGSTEPLRQEIAALKEELTKTQALLKVATFTGALAQGRLRAEQGEAQSWPDDVPRVLSRQQFETELQAQLVALEDFELHEVDCSEYPCVAAIRYTGDSEEANWFEEMHTTLSGWLEPETEYLSMSLNVSRFQDGDVDQRYVLFGAHSEAGENEALDTRTSFRIDELIEQLGDEVKSDAERSP